MKDTPIDLFNEINNLIHTKYKHLRHFEILGTFEMLKRTLQDDIFLNYIQNSFHLENKAQKRKNDYIG